MQEQRQIAPEENKQTGRMGREQGGVGENKVAADVE